MRFGWINTFIFLRDPNLISVACTGSLSKTLPQPVSFKKRCLDQHVVFASASSTCWNVRLNAYCTYSTCFVLASVFISRGTNEHSNTERIIWLISESLDRKLICDNYNNWLILLSYFECKNTETINSSFTNAMVCNVSSLIIKRIVINNNYN